MSNRRARGRAWARAFEDRFVAKNGVASPLDIYLTGLDLASPEELDAPYFALTRRQAILVRANIMVNGEGEEPDWWHDLDADFKPQQVRRALGDRARLPPPRPERQAGPDNGPWRRHPTEAVLHTTTAAIIFSGSYGYDDEYGSDDDEGDDVFKDSE